MIPKQHLQTYFYSPCLTRTQPLTSHYFTEINTTQREEPSFPQLFSIFKNICAFISFLPFASEMYSYLLVSNLSTEPTASTYLSILTASVSLSPLVSKWVLRTSILKPYPSAVTKSSCGYLSLFPPTAKFLEEVINLPSLSTSSQHYAYNSKDSLKPPHPDITVQRRSLSSDSTKHFVSQLFSLHCGYLYTIIYLSLKVYLFKSP